jgi:NhaP-type Na+/H+ or K+/H+ antiporter
MAIQLLTLLLIVGVYILGFIVHPILGWILVVYAFYQHGKYSTLKKIKKAEELKERYKHWSKRQGINT